LHDNVRLEKLKEQPREDDTLRLWFEDGLDDLGLALDDMRLLFNKALHTVAITPVATTTINQITADRLAFGKHPEQAQFNGVIGTTYVFPSERRCQLLTCP
jgi:hypothetical protein